MHIQLYFVDHKIQSFYVKARKEYEKRLGRYCRLDVFVEKNAGKLFKKIEKGIPVIAIIPGKKTISSEALAEQIKKMEVIGRSRINVVIGTELYQLCCQNDVEVKEVAMSAMSISEEMISVIFLEQIYRAYRIIHREPYHK